MDQLAVAVRMLQACRAVMHNQAITGADTVLFQRQFNSTVIAVSYLISESNGHDVNREALAFLVYVLDNGNVEAQTRFMEHVRNTRDETFFTSVADRIKTGIENIVEVGCVGTIFI